MKFSEKCPCGVKVSVPIVQIGTSAGWDRAIEQMKDWRENHRHEFAPMAPGLLEHPFIDETSSSHELALRSPIGFMAEPDYGD